MRGVVALAAVLVAACVDDVELASAPASRDAAVSVDTSAPRDAAGDGADAARPDAPSMLTVQAVLSVSTEGGSTAREWQTAIDVTVTRAGAPVTGAQVVWTSAFGTEEASPSSGRYRATQDGYAPWHELTVTMPDERATSQRWAWLPPHFISAPRADETHEPLTPLAVAWAPAGADEAQFTAPVTLPAMDDTGAATVPGAHFPREEGSVTVRLRRRATVGLTGFAAGSSVRIDVTASVRVTAP